MTCPVILDAAGTTCGCEHNIAKVLPLRQSWDGSAFKATVYFQKKCAQCGVKTTYSFPKEKALLHVLEE